MKERDFQTTFNHYLKAVHKKTGAFELKQTKGNALPFSAVVPHQVQALLNVKNGVFVYKIPDMGFQNPFDGFSLVNTDAFVVIKYPDFFCLIDINDWINEIKISTRKSLTAERAKEIATIIV